MQDFQPLHGSIFCGGGRAELRRIVGYPALAARRQQQQPPPPAKCPRCDSTNTKFCYYNNYNLSQPRHFCKSCRRYWTMGGVLRNVPVGGGCRKSKRPSSKTSPKPTPESADNDQSGRHPPPPSASLCSRDSTSISDTTNTTAAAASLLPDPPLLATQISISNPNPNFDLLPDVDPRLRPEPDIFQDPAAGAFTETPAALLGFGLHDPPPAQEKAAEAIRSAFADQTVSVDARPGGGGGGGSGLAPLDWSGQVEPTLYDLTCAVEPLSFWNQCHWSDADPSLYLP